MSRSIRPGRSVRRPSSAKARARLFGAEVGPRRLDAVPEDLRRPAAREAREECPPPQDRVRTTDGDDHPREPEEVRIPLLEGPVDPAHRVVLAPRVVVALLRAEELVPAQDHRHALADHQRGHQVAHLLLADPQHLGVVGRPLDAAVPAPVDVAAVAVPLAVGLVVLVVVARPGR